MHCVAQVRELATCFRKFHYCNSFRRPWSLDQSLPTATSPAQRIQKFTGRNSNPLKIHDLSASTERRPTVKSLRALSVRQPWAELIIRGEKEIEFRNYPTGVRGTVYIYASATRYPAEDEQEMQTQYDLDLDSLPRGVIVGTVEVYDCQQDTDGGYEWLLRSPTRLPKPLKPKRKPEPSWFFPF